MSAAIPMKRSAARNPHLIGGLALAILLGAAAMTVLLFGDPSGAIPRAVVHVPPAPPAAPADAPQSILAGMRPAERPLRGDIPDLDDPMLETLAPPPADAGDVTLPGVTPIDEIEPEDPGAPADAPAEPGMTARAEAPLPAAHFADALAPAPLPGLTEPGPGGLLPAIGPDGERPADAYARPFQDDGRPRVALVVGALGWNAERTREAIEELPPEVTLSFSPYADNLQAWIDRARAAGHEVMIEVPMEPFDYPQNDPGEQTLLTTAGASANIGKLQWLMSRATGYFAVVNYAGEKFLTSESSLTPVLGEIAGRGIDMLYFGAASNAPMARAAAAAGLEWTAADRALDSNLTPEDVQGQLAQLETLALQNGASLGYGFAYPFVIDEIAAWTAEAERRGYALAPASAVLDLNAGAGAP